MTEGSSSIAISVRPKKKAKIVRWRARKHLTAANHRRITSGLKGPEAEEFGTNESRGFRLVG